MPALQRSTMVIRVVLTWFLLTLGASVASPLVHPQATQLVCSAQGKARLVAVDDEEPAANAAHFSLDCALCLAVALPPTMARPSPQAHQPLAHALLPIVAAHIAALSRSPLPARGPPIAPHLS